MSKGINLYVRFQAEATFSIDEDVVKAYADKHGYDWDDDNEREEAIVCWVHDNVKPQVFTGLGGSVALGDGVYPVAYNIPGESILKVKEEA
jgi:hypothetical protein